MNCKKCGSPLAENDQFCKNCGETVNSQPTDMAKQTSVSIPNTNNLNSQPTDMAEQTSVSIPNTNNLNSQPTDMVEQTSAGIPNTNNLNSQPTDMVEQTSAGIPNTNNLNQQPMNVTQPNYSNNMNNNGQQGWANYNNAPMYNNQPMNKPSGNGKYIAIGFAILVGIIAIIVVVSMVMNKDEKNSLPSGETPSTTQSNKTNYKVAFKGFTFEIPDDFVYQERNGVLMIGNEEGTWAAILEVEQGSFSQLKTNKRQLQNIMQKNGYTSSIASEKNLGGVDFITMEISMSGKNAIAALAKANSMYFIGVTAMNQDNEFDYKLLKTIAPIVKSAQYNGNTTNNISENTKIDMSAISELAK